MRTMLVVLGGAVILAVAGVWMSSASAITKPTSLTLVAPNTDDRSIDLGEPGPSLGDMFVFSGPLRDAKNTAAGRIDGHCVTTSAPSNDSAQVRRQCIVTATLGTKNGETEIQLRGVGRIPADDVLLSVTGGTNRYRNVRGQALFDYRRNDRVTISFQLRP